MNCAANCFGFNGIKPHILLHLIEDLIGIPCPQATSTGQAESRMRVLDRYIALRAGTNLTGQALRDAWVIRANEYEVMELFARDGLQADDSSDGSLLSAGIPEVNDSDDDCEFCDGQIFRPVKFLLVTHAT